MSKPGPISAKPLSILLSAVFSDAYAKQGFAARELVTRWAEIAGAEIAAHSEPIKLQWPRPVEEKKIRSPSSPRSMMGIRSCSFLRHGRACPGHPCLKNAKQERRGCPRRARA